MFPYKKTVVQLQILTETCVPWSMTRTRCRSLETQAKLASGVMPERTDVNCLHFETRRDMMLSEDETEVCSADQPPRTLLDVSLCCPPSPPRTTPHLSY